MRQYPPRSKEETYRLLDRFKEAFRNRQAGLRRGTALVRVPELRGLYERHADMAYHFKPELFLQTGGCTLFRTPVESFALQASEICIMPMGVPHHEVAESRPTAFENVVVCFYSKTVTVHLATCVDGSRPEASDIFFFQPPYFQELVSIVNLATSLSHSHLPDSKAGVQGLLIGFFSLLLNMISTENEAASPESQRVYQCQWKIRNHLNDPELSVHWLAESLDCSSNYLSKIFHDEIGEKITNYITRVRLENAVYAMRDTALSVKEISNACGFRDPNYFSRVFRQSFNVSPKEYRQRLLDEAKKQEQRPKLVRGDYEEYHFGYDRDKKLITGS